MKRLARTILQGFAWSIPLLEFEDLVDELASTLSNITFASFVIGLGFGVAYMAVLEGVL